MKLWLTKGTIWEDKWFTLKRTPGISPTACPRRPNPAISTSSCLQIVLSMKGLAGPDRVLICSSECAMLQCGNITSTGTKDQACCSCPVVIYALEVVHDGRLQDCRQNIDSTLSYLISLKCKPLCCHTHCQRSKCLLQLNRSSQKKNQSDCWFSRRMRSKREMRQ